MQLDILQTQYEYSAEAASLLSDCLPDERVINPTPRYEEGSDVISSVLRKGRPVWRLDLRLKQPYI